MSCCRAGCPQTAGKQGLKPPQSSPGSVLGERGAYTPVQGHVCGAKPSQWSCGSSVCSSAGGQGSKRQIHGGQTPWARVYPTSHGFSCHPSAGQLLRVCLCDFNTLTGCGVHSSCVHSCSNVISALLSLLFVCRAVAAWRGCSSLEAPAAPWKLLQLFESSCSSLETYLRLVAPAACSESEWIQCTGSYGHPSAVSPLRASHVPCRASRVPLTRLLSAPTDRGIIMTFGSGSNGCLGHGNFTDVSQVGGEGAGRACSPRVKDGSWLLHHVRGLIPAPGMCIPGMLWHLTPSPSSPCH